MPDEPTAPEQNRDFRPMFTTTSWTAVVKAGRSDSLEARDALTRLCSTYWQPLHAYLRRSGHTDSDAKDLTQEFFYVLLSKNYLNAADRTKGKFRSFLLTAFKHFLSNQRDRASAAKRGGGQPLFSLDQPVEDDGPTLDPGVDLTPASLFERQWAATLFRQAESRLRADYASQGKTALFERLHGFLEGETQWGEYGAVGKELGMSSAAVATAVHRLRHRYAEVLREEVAQTLVNPTHEEIEEELQHLFTIFEK
jgi:RNA polymerase sigma-70 factor (ECF subfamily)